MQKKIIIGFIVFCAVIEIVGRLVGGENAGDIGYAIGYATPGVVVFCIIFVLFDCLIYVIAKWARGQSTGIKIFGNIIAGFLSICVGVLSFRMKFGGPFGDMPIALFVMLNIIELCALGFIFYKVLKCRGWEILDVILEMLIKQSGMLPKQSSVFPVSFEDMDGHEFEHFCADILRRNGFERVRVTPASGDQGVDILAEKDGLKFAIQCKKWSNPIGNTAVQEVSAGRAFYQCDVAVVLTNSTFTKGAIELAKATGVLLWGRDKLYGLIHSATDSLS